MRRLRHPLNAFGAWERAVDGEEGGEAAEVPSTPSYPADCGHTDPCLSVAAFLDRLSSPLFQQMLEQILVPCKGYRLDFDGTQFDGFQVHLDLNEPVSASSQSFMALGSTPPSAHIPDHGACSYSDSTCVTHTRRAS
ncbi:hypothetical protein PIB30_058599 [Stylosanthes scabra]|uniref:Uncharacterized protein n=1 Tax=Stylosanthes scabra TaxID=79078 RepID=A0ABU6VMG6_9FABA|nr:hypothetical protein [Stylosanthes scabra]